MKNFTLSFLITLIAIIFYPNSKVLSKEKSELSLTQFHTATTIYCGPTIDFHEVFPKNDLKFTGFIDQDHILKLFISEDNEYVVIVENVHKLSCVHFGGSPGMIIKKEISY